MNKTVEQLQSYSKQVQEYLDVMQVKMVTGDTTMQMIETMQLCSNVLLHCMDTQNKLSDKLDLIHEHAKDLLQAIIERHVPTSLIPGSKIQQDIKYISGKLSHGLAPATGLDISSFLRGDSAEVVIEDRAITFTYRIPVIHTVKEETCYHLRSLPVFAKDRWLKLSLDNSVYVVNKRDHSWRRLEYSDYLGCKTTPFSTCNEDIPVWTTGMDTCVINTLFNQPIDIQQCMLEEHKIPTNRQLLVEATGPCSWLVSPGKNSLQVSQSCDPVYVKESSAKTAMMEQVTHVALMRGCQVKVGPTLLSCTPLLQQTSSIINSSYELIFSDLMSDNWGSMSDIDVLTDRLNRATLSSQKTNKTSIPTLNLNNVIMDAGFVNVSKLLHSSNPEQKFMDRNDALSDWAQSLGNAQGEGSSWMQGWSIFPGMLGYLVPSFSTVIAIAALLISILAYRRSLVVRSAGMMMALADKTPGAWGLVLAPTLQQVNKTDVRENITKVINSTIHYCNCTNATLPEENLCNTIDWYSVAIMSLIMLVIHSLLVYICCQASSHRATKNLLKMGYMIRNQKAIHHEGEVSLCISVFVNLGRVFSRGNVIRELVFQVCTLPRSYQECDRT